MSAITKVCFDASIHDEYVGVGIFNFDTNEKLAYRFKVSNVTSEFAETIALIKTINYLRSRNIKQVHLFTDNQGVAKKVLVFLYQKNLKILH